MRRSVPTIAAGVRRRLRRVAGAVRRSTARALPPATVALTVADLVELRRHAAAHPGRRVASLRVTVTGWRAPLPGWSGRLGPVPGLTGHRLRLPASGRGRAEVELTLAEPVTLAQAIAAVLGVLAPHRPLPTPASPDLAVEGPLPGWLPPAELHRPSPRQEPTHLRRHDVILTNTTGDGTLTPPTPDEPARVTTSADGIGGLVIVDPATAGPDLAGLLAPADLLATAGGTADDPVEREIAAIQRRRAVLRRHLTGLALPVALADAYASLSRPPTVTALLLTRRPEALPGVLADLARQTYPELEVVVGLHGRPATAAVRAAVAAYPGRLELVEVPGAVSFGAALGEVTRQARGSLVTKVDDDDRYGPEHVWDLVLARAVSGATVVGKGAEFVYLAPRDRTVRRVIASEVYDGYVAGGTMLIARGDLEAVGGWRPVSRSADRALLDRVLGAGGLVYRTHGFGYLYVRHDEGHTWDVPLDQFEHDAVRRWDGLPPYSEFGL